MSSKYDNMPLTDQRGRTIHRMSCAERAKIFMPFDALKGLREALRETEERIAREDGLMWSESPFEDDEGEACSLPW